MNVLLASTKHNKDKKEEKLLHLSCHFSLFLIVSMLFKCRFAA